jgi:hypothetical protein
MVDSGPRGTACLASSKAPDPRSSDGTTREKDWSQLWHCKVPSKVHLFLWRLAKQSLPTNEVRHDRKMADDDRCQLCGAQDTWRHALLDCTMSRCVWALADEEVTEHMHRSEEGNSRECLATLTNTLCHRDHTSFSSLSGQYGMREGRLYTNRST